VLNILFNFLPKPPEHWAWKQAVGLCIQLQRAMNTLKHFSHAHTIPPFIHLIPLERKHQSNAKKEVKKSHLHISNRQQGQQQG
jgi:hypothetical protein